MFNQDVFRKNVREVFGPKNKTNSFETLLPHTPNPCPTSDDNDEHVGNLFCNNADLSLIKSDTTIVGIPKILF